MEAIDSKNSGSSSPVVSVIVPVYNEVSRISTCIQALLEQTYPSGKYEVLIVDNGSSDGTRDVVQRYPVTLLIEDQIQGSYAARNKGINHARGRILAFTDSDCTPVPSWIENGVNALGLHKADLASGNVRFVYSWRPTRSEIIDSITNMQIEQNIRERHVTKTANLFARSELFKKIGLFPYRLQSGGDVIWTGQAVKQGCKLVYAPEAEVSHPARRIYALIKKQYRVGKGQTCIWRGEEGLATLVIRIVLGFRPPSVTWLQNTIRDRVTANIHHSFISIWFAAWASCVATNLGRIDSLLRPSSSSPYGEVK